MITDSVETSQLEYIHQLLSRIEETEELHEATKDYQEKLEKFTEDPTDESGLALFEAGQRVAKLGRKSLDILSTIASHSPDLQKILDAGIDGSPHSVKPISVLGPSLKAIEGVMLIGRTFEAIQNHDKPLDAQQLAHVLILGSSGAYDLASVFLHGVHKVFDQTDALDYLKPHLDDVFETTGKNFLRYKDLAEKAFLQGNFADHNKFSKKAVDVFADGAKRVGDIADELATKAAKQAISEGASKLLVGLDVLSIGLDVATVANTLSSVGDGVSVSEGINIAASFLSLAGSIAGAASYFAVGFPPLAGALKAFEIAAGIGSTLLYVAGGATQAVEDNTKKGIDTNFFEEVDLSISSLKDTILGGGSPGSTDLNDTILSMINPIYGSFNNIINFGSNLVSAIFVGEQDLDFFQPNHIARISTFEKQLQRSLADLANSFGIEDWEVNTAYSDSYVKHVPIGNRNIELNFSYSFDEPSDGKGFIITNTFLTPEHNFYGTSGNDFAMLAQFDDGTSFDAGDGDDHVIVGSLFAGYESNIFKEGYDKFIRVHGGDGFDILDLSRGADSIEVGANQDDGSKNPDHNRIIAVDLATGLGEIRPYARSQLKDATNLFLGFEGVRGTDYSEGFYNVEYVEAFGGSDYIEARTDRKAVLFGGGGSDTIHGSSKDDLIEGGDGFDHIYSGAGDDVVIGGSGNDRVRAGYGDDFISVGSGHDTVWGGAGDDTILMGAETGKIIKPSHKSKLIFGKLFGDSDAPADTKEGLIDTGAIYGGEGFDVLIADANNAGLFHKSVLYDGERGVEYLSHLTDYRLGKISATEYKLSNIVDISSDAYSAYHRGEGHFADYTVQGIEAIEISDPNGDDRGGAIFLNFDNRDHETNNFGDLEVISTGGGEDYVHIRGADHIDALTLVSRGKQDVFDFDGEAVKLTAIMTGEGGTVVAGIADDVLDGRLATEAVYFYGGAGDDILIAQNNSAPYVLRGGDGNDVLIGGLTQHRHSPEMSGGEGRDVFVVRPDLEYDFSEDTSENILFHIRDFELGVDLIDVSAVTEAYQSSVANSEYIFNQTISLEYHHRTGSTLVTVHSSKTDHKDNVIATFAIAHDFDDRSSREPLALSINDFILHLDDKPREHLQSAYRKYLDRDYAENSLVEARSLLMINEQGDAWGEAIDGTQRGDVLTDGDGPDRIMGLGGNDHITAGKGNDTVFGGNGHDVIKSGDGDDSIDGGRQFDTVHAGNGNDVVSGGMGRDVVHLEAGDDWYKGDHQSDIGYSEDIVYGGSGHDTIAAEGGNDTLFGGSGDDLIGGGAGDDSINGGLHFDIIHAGDGNDVVSGGLGRDTVYLDQGNDTFLGHTQSAQGYSEDVIYGGSGHDIIQAKGGADTLFGGNGNDTLTGGAGSDYIEGGDGSDLAVLAGRFEDYSIRLDDGFVFLTNSKNGEIDQISDVERFQFLDTGKLTFAQLLGGDANGVDLTDVLGDQVTARASSTYNSQYSADRVLDGITGGQNFFHSGRPGRSWLEVDLGDSFDISRIELVNREQFGERLNGAAVVISDGKGSELYRFNEIQNASNGETLSFDVDQNLESARYIRVEHDSDWLQLSEVNVFGVIDQGYLG